MHIYRYNPDNNVWNQLGQDIGGNIAGDQTGYSVSLSSDGSIIAFGTPISGRTGGSREWRGHAEIWSYNEVDNLWTQLGKDIKGESKSAHSGKSVALSDDGSIIAIGAVGASTGAVASGQVRIFEYINNEWEQIGEDIDGRNRQEQLGVFVVFLMGISKRLVPKGLLADKPFRFRKNL